MGSSPYQRRSPRPEQQRETLSSHDPLIKLSVDVRLKNTVNQRLTSGLRMGTHAVQSDTWDEVKNMLWGIIQRELKPLAIPTGAPPVWTVDEHEPAIVMFEKYTSLKMNGKVLNPWTSAKDREYLRKHKEEPAILSVYRYAVAPVGRTRSQETQASARARNYKGPPPNLVTQFRPASNPSEQQLQHVQRSVKMAKKVVQGMQTKIQHFEQTVQVLQTAIVSMNQMLENHLDVIEAMGEDVVIQPDSTEVSSVLAAIPNQEDIDHA
ncbi:hypothetical protein PInf_026018 [Phytophthora infestans]|nr:hypothetical protein PInf_025915 [Phytophthora infestans]KAI9986949.1 hypothetical protein PInf_026018 [Phytophthora infestans]